MIFLENMDQYAKSERKYCYTVEFLRVYMGQMGQREHLLILSKKLDLIIVLLKMRQTCIIMVYIALHDVIANESFSVSLWSHGDFLCVFLFLLLRGNTPETRGTAYVVYEDIFDAKNACDHLSGFNVCNRYLVVLYYNANRVCMSITLPADVIRSKDNLSVCFKKCDLKL